MAVTARDKQMAVGQEHDFVDIAGDRNPTEAFAVGVEFFNLMFTFAGNEVVAIAGFAGAAKLVVKTDGGGRWGEFDFPGDFTGTIDFENTARAVLDDHHVAIGQRLAGVDLGFFTGFVFPDDFLVAGHFECTPGVAEKKISIGQGPTILRMVAGKFPFDGSVCGDGGNFASVGIRAEKGVGGLKQARQRQQGGKDACEKGGAHGIL